MIYKTNQINLRRSMCCSTRMTLKPCSIVMLWSNKHLRHSIYEEKRLLNDQSTSFLTKNYGKAWAHSSKFAYNRWSSSVPYRFHMELARAFVMGSLSVCPCTLSARDCCFRYVSDFNSIDIHFIFTKSVSGSRNAFFVTLSPFISLFLMIMLCRIKRAQTTSFALLVFYSVNGLYII